MPNPCQTCGGVVEHLLDAGRHPVANRYLSTPLADERLFALALGQCRTCGLVQLTTIVPPEELIPTYEWITYNEPEGHLDAVTDALSRLPDVCFESVIGGVTYKDDSTLARLQARGFSHTWRIDPTSDLGAPLGAGLETIQARLPERTEDVQRRYGQADLLLVRHILEHAHDTRRFVSALRRLVRPGGYLVFEVPDCSQVLETLDYTTIWEEHVLYFTAPTYRRAFEALGFETVGLHSYPYPYENSLVGVVRNVDSLTPHREAGHEVDRERSRAQRFASAFADRRRAIQTFLSERCERGERVALFGAGHLSCMFINVNEVAPYITFVVDDHPGKRGLFMPGSRLPIRASEALVTEQIHLCLSSLSPESEEKVVAKQTELLARGGTFASIFPSARRALDFSRAHGAPAC